MIERQRCKVLLIAPPTFLATELVERLTSSVVSIACATTFVEAEDPWDCVLLHCADDPDFSKTLASSPALDCRQTPVVAIIGAGDIEKGHAAVAAGVVHYCTVDELTKHTIQQTVRFFRRSLVARSSAQRDTIASAVQATEHDEFRRQLQRVLCLGQLAVGVTHHLNNQLQTVVGFAEILTRDAPAEFQPYASRILDAGTGTAQLLQRLLTHGRRDWGRSLFRAHELISDVVTIIDRASGSAVHVATQLDASTDLLEADWTELEAVLLTLGMWLAEDMPNGGTISVATTTMLAGELPASQVSADCPLYLRIRMQGDGESIVAAQQSSAFAPYWPDPLFDRTATGLELAIAHASVAAHGGNMLLPDCSNGVAVDVFLPVHERRPKPAGAPTPAEASEQFTVLLVDDHEHVRNLAARMLVKIGHEVEAFADGETALAYFNEHAQNIDLVFADAMLPGVSGFDLCQRIRDVEPQLPIVLMSGDDEAHCRERLSATTGAEPLFLAKPFLFKDLTVLLNRLQSQ